jgi:SAM-dependent methyltransferase
MLASRVVDWRLKGTIQRVLGSVPGGGRLHYLLQRRVGGLTDFGRECDIKVDDWRLMMGHLRSANIPVAGSTFIEIGTGWYPTFPFCLYLAGAGRVYTYDLNRLLKPDMTAQLADRLQAHLALIATESGKSIDQVETAHAALVQSMSRGMSLARATGNVVDYRAPADASTTTLLSGSVDVVFSNSVLEHVPGSVIEALFAESMRVLRPGGIMFHSVNCGDHYAYTDRSIDQLHYLQYSDSEWERWNNEFLYQNRLRAKDFTEMATRAGFVLELDTSRASHERLQQLDAIAVDPSFARYSREQLAITSIDFIARKAG